MCSYILTATKNVEPYLLCFGFCFKWLFLCLSLQYDADGDG